MFHRLSNGTNCLTVELLLSRSKVGLDTRASSYTAGRDTIAGVTSTRLTEDQINDPLMRKGVQYLVDGVEHMLMHSLLEKYKQTLLRDMETRYDMILDGIETLGSGYTPEMVKEKLKTHIPA